MTLTFLQRKPDSGLGNIKASPSDPSRNIDWVLMLMLAAIATIGCFVVYSASRTKQADPFLYVTRQVIFMIAAVIAMVVVMTVDYEMLRERARFFYGVSIMFLVLVIIAGTVSGGARLSFDLGPLKLQPAEFSKATVLLALSAYLAEERSDEVSYPRFLGGLIMVGVPSALIIIQPDLGSSSVLVAMAMGVLLVAGAKPKYIMLITLMSVATVVAAVVSGIVNRYQLRRIEAFFNQDSSDAALRDYIAMDRMETTLFADSALALTKAFSESRPGRLRLRPALNKVIVERKEGEDLTHFVESTVAEFKSALGKVQRSSFESGQVILKLGAATIGGINSMSRLESDVLKSLDPDGRFCPFVCQGLSAGDSP